MITISFKESESKLIFFYDAIKKKKLIEAHIFNDVFDDFYDKFYENKSYKNAMSNFKKYMKLAAENTGNRISIIPASGNIHIHGIKNIWLLHYLS